MLKMSTREQCQVRTRPKEKTGKNMIWDTLAFNPDDMRYSCSGVACLQRYYRGERKLSIFERLRWECPLRYEEGLSIFAEHFEKVVCGIWKADAACEDYRQGGLASSVSNSNPVEDLALEISENGASSIFEKVILLGVWLSRFRERCLFDF
ncbi:hypothetical protein ACFXTO_047541 [Malus domestica]